MIAVVSAPAVPDHLKGYIGRFLQQMGPSIFVGKISRRRADSLWEQLVDKASEGGIIMVCSANNDAGFDIKICNIRDWGIVDFDGILLPVVKRHLH